MHNHWRVATNGKGALFLKNGHVATPTLRTPIVIGIAESIEKAVGMKAKRLVVTRLPKATYRVDYCTFCNLDGCDECNERGFEFYPVEGCQYWLEYNGEFYLFCLDLLHRLDEFAEVEYVIMPPTDKSKPFMTMGVFILPNCEGFAVIMSMTPGNGSPKRPVSFKRVSKETK